jgi:hypothetical protein
VLLGPPLGPEVEEEEVGEEIITSRASREVVARGYWEEEASREV